MFDGLKDMGKMLKQAKEMKSKMKSVQDELKKIICKGEADGVTVELTGELLCVGVSIANDDLLTNKSRLEKAIKEATNKASKESKELAASKLSAVTGDMNLNLPGM